jgi:membrane protein implicated in regulation of membrane protease activity
MTIAEWFVNLAIIYAMIGLVFAIAFIIIGIGRIDPAAKGSPLTFRLLILPGVAVLWPVLLKRWLGGQSHPPDETNSHRQAAREGKS